MKLEVGRYGVIVTLTDTELQELHSRRLLYCDGDEEDAYGRRWLRVILEDDSNRVGTIPAPPQAHTG